MKQINIYFLGTISRRIHKTCLYIFLLLLTIFNLQSQNLLTNGNFEDHEGSIFTMVDWEKTGTVVVCESGAPDFSCAGISDWNEGEDNGDWHSDGVLFRDYNFIQGVEYTLSMDIRTFPQYTFDFEYGDFKIFLLEPSPFNFQIILNEDTEQYAQNSFLNISITFIAQNDFSKLYFTMDGFAYEVDITGVIAQPISIDNVVLESVNGPNYHFANSNDVEMTDFCNETPIFLNAEASESVEKYKVAFYRRALSDGPDADFQWLNITDWIIDDEIGTLNLNTLASSIGVTIYPGFEYRTNLIIQNEFSNWWSMFHEFTYQVDPNPSFQILDEDGNESTSFCLNEEIHFNGTPSSYEEYYMLRVLEYEQGSNNANWIVSTNWLIGQINDYNLSGLIANSGHNFSSGFDYEVELNLLNSCGNVVIEDKLISIVNCCEAAQNLDCFNKFGQPYLDWDPVPGASSYSVEIDYNNWKCCKKNTTSSSIVHYAGKISNLKVPTSNSSCFSWRVLTFCNGQLYYSKWSCFDTKVGCLDVQISSELDLRSKEISQVKVFPNPASDMIYISDNIERDNYKLSLIDMNGQLINEHFDTKNIDISNVNNGVYILVIQSNDEIIYREPIVIMN